jgi:hypothetical protein
MSDQVYLFRLNANNDSEAKFELDDTRGLDKIYRKVIGRPICTRKICTVVLYGSCTIR